MKLFSKSFDLALALSGRQPEKKLGKQRSVFPGRRRTEKAASRKLGNKARFCPLSRLTAPASRLLALSVTAAAVPAPPKGEPSRQLTRGLQKAKSRLPLWGRCPPREGGEGSPLAPRTIPCPPPSLIPKGGTRLGRGDRKARRKPPWHRRCHQGSRLPPRSALNGAHRAPAPPGEGPPPKNVPPGHF